MPLSEAFGQRLRGASQEDRTFFCWGQGSCSLLYPPRPRDGVVTYNRYLFNDLWRGSRRGALVLGGDNTKCKAPAAGTRPTAHSRTNTVPCGDSACVAGPRLPDSGSFGQSPLLLPLGVAAETGQGPPFPPIHLECFARLESFAREERP